MTRMQKMLLMLLLVYTKIVSSSVVAPSFDCKKANTNVEKWICEDAEIAALDVTLSVLYKSAKEKSTDAETVKQQQIYWLENIRNLCGVPSCVGAAYRQRIAVLEDGLSNNVFPLGIKDNVLFMRNIKNINDTVVVSGVVISGRHQQQLQVEFYPDLTDHLQWVYPGPRVILYCRDPNKREGYAGRFEHTQTAYGIDFKPVYRNEEEGRIFLRFTLGKDIPINEPALCRLVFSEWLLEKPSKLYILVES